jgi:hypothetical protein
VVLSVGKKAGNEVQLSVREADAHYPPEKGLMLKCYSLLEKKQVLQSYCLSGKKEALKWYRMLGRSEEILIFSIRKKHFMKWNYLSGKRQVLTTTRRRLPRATPSYRRPTRGGRQAASTGPDIGSPSPP